MSSEHKEVPQDLITHSPAESQTSEPAPVQTQGGEVPPENIVSQPTYTGGGQSAFSPNKSGLVAAGIVAPTALAGQEIYKGYNYLTQGMSPNQKYANATIGDRWNIPLKDIQRLTNYPVPLSHSRLIQDAAKQITGAPAVPDTIKEIYTIDPKTGQQTLSYIEKTPGSPAVPPMDPAKLKQYERTFKNKAIQHGALPGRAGVAAYDIGRAFSPDEDPFARAVDIAGGTSMVAAPLIPKKIGKVPARAIATGLGFVPGAMGAYEATQKADGGLVHLAGGGRPEDAPYIGYPQINRNRQTGYGTGYLDTLATSIDPTGVAGAMQEVNAGPSIMTETPSEQSYREGKEAAQPIADFLSTLQLANFGKQLVKPVVKHTVPKIMKLAEQAKHLNIPKGYAGGKSVIKKFTEAIIPHEGKTILGTLSDRTKATEGFYGGPGFINLHPDYTWAVDAPGVATKHLGAVERFGGPKQTVFAPMLMSTEAHKSNRPVFEKIYGDLQQKIKSGEFTPEQIEKLNARILAEKGVDLSKSPGVQSPEFLDFANAFHRRGKVADILGLKKTGGVDLQKHLSETIDPALREAEVGAVGPQLFTMESTKFDPSVHPGYTQMLLGEKGADQFTPVPREFLFRDLEKQAMEQMGRPMTDYNYRNILKEHGAVPNQLIDDKLIKSLQDLGYKKGGKVKKKKK